MVSPPAQTRHLVLIGLRGSGKSTIGRALATLQQRQFFDLDDLTPRELGCATVAQAWSLRGEAAFREAEHAALARLLTDLRHGTPEREAAERGAIIALGGGTPTATGVPELLRTETAAGRAVVIYLREAPDVLRRRLRGGITGDRPSLTGANPLDEIEAVFRARDPLYRAIATRELTGFTTPQEATSTLADWERW